MLLSGSYEKKGLPGLSTNLDDFLVIGAPNTGECQSFLDKMLSYCNTLGFPLATDKIEGPCTSLCFLGICLDTIAMEAKLPDDKLLRLSKELGEWTVRKACTRRELEHLIGLLHFACNVIPQGRPFVHRLINLLCMPAQSHTIMCSLMLRLDLTFYGGTPSFHPGMKFPCCFFPKQPFPQPIFFRRFRKLGLWGSLGETLVPRPMASRLGPNQHNGQGVGPYGTSSSSLGSLLDSPISDLP
jgi:hypothetical protein